MSQQQPQPLVIYTAPPGIGVSIDGQLFNALLGQAPCESPWMPVSFAKSLSFDLEGSLSTISVQLLGSNSQSDPGNSYSITIGGSATANDVLSLQFQNPNLTGGTETVSVTAAGGETTAQLATALAAAINADTKLAALQITASVSGSVITVNYPSAAPPNTAEGGSPTAPPNQNTTVITGSVSGSATETITVANASTGASLGSAITAKGMTAVTPLPGWIKAQINTLTGTGASVTGNIHGAA